MLRAFQATNEFTRLVDSVAAQLATTAHRSDGSYVSTPLLYPSGASVVVRVSPDAGKAYFVSDFGAGYMEADLMGATPTYTRHARSIAEHAGVSFDQHAFFAVHVSEDRLPGAVATIANCSLEAVALTAFKLSERRALEDSNLLYERLVSIFDRKRVEKDADILGASQTPWRVAAIVKGAGRPTIFEAVTKNHISVVNAATKLNDIARLEFPPHRVAVVRGKKQFGTYLGILSQAADVVDIGVPDETYRKLTHAA